MNEKIIKIIRETIQVTVNGKIDKMHAELVKHQEEERVWQVDIQDHLKMQDEKLEELRPFIESKNTIVGLRKFLLWVATPFAILWGVFEFISKR